MWWKLCRPATVPSPMMVRNRGLLLTKATTSPEDGISGSSAIATQASHGSWSNTVAGSSAWAHPTSTRLPVGMPRRSPRQMERNTYPLGAAILHDVEDLKDTPYWSEQFRLRYAGAGPGVRGPASSRPCSADQRWLPRVGAEPDLNKQQIGMSSPRMVGPPQFPTGPDERSADPVVVARVEREVTAPVRLDVVTVRARVCEYFRHGERTSIDKASARWGLRHQSTRTRAARVGQRHQMRPIHVHRGCAG